MPSAIDRRAADPRRGIWGRRWCGCGDVHADFAPRARRVEVTCRQGVSSWVTGPIPRDHNTTIRCGVQRISAGGARMRHWTRSPLSSVLQELRTIAGCAKSLREVSALGCGCLETLCGEIERFDTRSARRSRKSFSPRGMQSYLDPCALRRRTLAVEVRSLPLGSTGRRADPDIARNASNKVAVLGATCPGCRQRTVVALGLTVRRCSVDGLAAPRTLWPCIAAD